MQITTIGLDIAKNVFQVHGIDAAEKVVVRKQLRRGQVIAFFKALVSLKCPIFPLHRGRRPYMALSEHPGMSGKRSLSRGKRTWPG